MGERGSGQLDPSTPTGNTTQASKGTATVTGSLFSQKAGGEAHREAHSHSSTGSPWGLVSREAHNQNHTTGSWWGLVTGSGGEAHSHSTTGSPWGPVSREAHNRSTSTTGSWWGRRSPVCIETMVTGWAAVMVFVLVCASLFHWLPGMALLVGNLGEGREGGEGGELLVSGSQGGCQNYSGPDLKWDNVKQLLLASNVTASMAADLGEATSLRHLAFGIASSAAMWKQRQAVIRTWWVPNVARGAVWLDELTGSHTAGPIGGALEGMEVRVSEAVDGIPYFGEASPEAVRIARIVVEMQRLEWPDVRWFVLIDDDTFIVPGALLAVLSRLSHDVPFYVGGTSETLMQLVKHGHSMAYGGGGIAISAPLARRLAATMDRCMHRYGDLYGSDGRIAACAAELGVPLTRMRGFHQCDFHGDSVRGLMEAHPPEPFVSLHHTTELLQSPLPSEPDNLRALSHLGSMAWPDPVGFLQQAVCYDGEDKEWTMAISWGFSVTVYQESVPLRTLQQAQVTFKDWRDWSGELYKFNMDVRKADPPFQVDRPCRVPFAMYATKVWQRKDGRVVSVYTRMPHTWNKSDATCHLKVTSLESIVVIRNESLTAVTARTPLSHGPTLRRECCKKIVLEPSARTVKLLLGNAAPPKPFAVVYIGVCEEGDTISPRS